MENTILVRVVPQVWIRDEAIDVQAPLGVRLEFEVLETWPGFVKDGAEIAYARDDGDILLYDLSHGGGRWVKSSWDFEWLDRWVRTGIGTYRIEVVE
jgi:hypothetical protein